MKAVLLQAFALSALAAIASAQVPAGPDFRVNTYTTGSQYQPRIAVEPDGDFVVVVEQPAAGFPDIEVFGQRFDVDRRPTRAGVQAQRRPAHIQLHPSIAALGRRGDFVVGVVGAVSTTAPASVSRRGATTPPAPLSAVSSMSRYGRATTRTGRWRQFAVRRDLG